MNLPVFDAPPEALSLPKIDPETVPLRNLLSVPREKYYLELLGLVVQTRAGVWRAEHAKNQVFWIVDVDLAGSRLSLFVPSSLCRWLCGELRIEADDPSCLDDFGLLVFMIFLSAFLEKLESAGHETFRIDGIRNGAGKGDIVMAIEAGIGAQTFFVGVDGPRGAVLKAANLGSRMPVRRFPTPDLPMPVRVLVPLGKITLARFKTLEAGDAISICQAASGAVKVNVSSPLGEARATLHDQCCTLTEPLQAIESESDMKTTTEDLQHDGPNATDGDIVVRLAFVAGEKNLPLRDLQSLGAGYVFELENDLECSVDIVANSRKVGTGRLVNLAGRLGVQVETIF